MGKGSDRRPKLITLEEEDLRWELISASPERKKEIKKRLEELKQK